MTASPRLFDRLIAAWHERAIVLKAMSFAAVGVVNAAVDFAVFSFAYYYLGLPIVTANVMAWLVAVSGSYVMNSLTTFARESGRELRAKAYFTFVISQVAGLSPTPPPSSSRPISCRCWSARCWRSAQAFWSTSRCRTSSCFASARSENRGSAIVQLTKHGHVGMRHHPGGRTAQSDPPCHLDRKIVAVEKHQMPGMLRLPQVTDRSFDPGKLRGRQFPPIDDGRGIRHVALHRTDQRRGPE